LRYARWFSTFHPRVFEEIKIMARATSREPKITLEPMIEYLGMEGIIQQLGVERVVQYLGAKRVLEHLTAHQIVQELGALADKLSPEDKKELRKLLK
jgi:hypothetical protein